MYRFAVASAIALSLCLGAAEASQQGLVAQGNWRQMDKCAKQAQAAFPDYTADANAKRDGKLKECLNLYNLPPHQPYQPQPR